MFEFEPKSEEEIQSDRLWPKGIYDFEVLDAINTDQNGDPLMTGTGYKKINLKLKLFNEEGRSTNIFDDLSTNPKILYKVRHFFDSIGKIKLYESGKIEDVVQLIGQNGKVNIYQKIDPTGEYQPKNAVSDYIKPKDGEAKTVAKQEEPFSDDELPF